MVVLSCVGLALVTCCTTLVKNFTLSRRPRVEQLEDEDSRISRIISIGESNSPCDGQVISVLSSIDPSHKNTSPRTTPRKP